MMYFVNLSLNGPEAEYKPLFDTIKTLGPWSNRLASTWLLECNLSSKQVRDLLKPHLKSADRVFVGEFVRNWAATNMGTGFPEWMDRRVTVRDGKDREATAPGVEIEKG